MRRTLRLVGIALIVLCWVGAAQAAEKKIGLGLKLGYHNFVRYNPTDDPDGDGVLEDGEIDQSIDAGAFDGFAVEGDFEYRFHPNFVLGGGVQWYGANVIVDGVTDENRVKGDIALSITALTITPKIVLPIKFVNLYTGGGLGLYWRVLGSSYEYTDRFGNDTSESNADSQGTLGYHAMVGAEFFVLNWIGIVLEDRFAFVHFKGQDPKTDLDDNDAGGNSVFLGTRFHF
ncbi:MAG: outer membrane beta-barrel protein [Candidatus Lernaella stagnicola]|nr:outer membrane beta-barrel protein [Candidatus Lernaella stagnicola]